MSSTRSSTSVISVALTDWRNCLANSTARANSPMRAGKMLFAAKPIIMLGTRACQRNRPMGRRINAHRTAFRAKETTSSAR